MVKPFIISDVIEDFINSIDFSQDVISFSDNGIDTTIVVSNVYHSIKGNTAFLDGNEIIIKEVDYKMNTVTFIGVILSAVTYKVKTPILIHGFSRMVTNKVKNLVSERNTPFIYLLGNGSFNINNNRNATYDIEENISIFFVADGSVYDLSGVEESDYHTDNVIKPLTNLAIKFNNELLKYPIFGVEQLEKSVNGTGLVGFGDVYKGRGKNPTENVFNANLDALGLTFELPIDTSKLNGC